MTLLAIDPGRSFKGEASIGVSLWETNRALDWGEIERRSLTFEEFSEKLSLDWIEDHRFCTPPCPDFSLSFDGWYLSDVVIEDYVNNAQSKGGQRNGTSECIGAVEFACIKTNTPFIRQPPSALGPAKIHAGYDQKVKHLPHQDSAYLHGFEYLVRKGLVAPVNLAATMKEH